MVILYRGKWNSIQVYIELLLSFCHMHNDNNSQQDWQKLHTSFCSKLTLIHIKWHTRLSTNFRNCPFRLTRIINYFICSFSASMLHWPTQFPFFRISTSILWNNLFDSFLFWRNDFWLTSSLNVKRLQIIFHLVKHKKFLDWCQFRRLQ